MNKINSRFYKKREEKRFINVEIAGLFDLSIDVLLGNFGLVYLYGVCFLAKKITMALHIFQLNPMVSK